MDEEEKGWMDTNINGEDNIAIEYNYIPWRILVIVIVMLKLFGKTMRELNVMREKGTKLELLTMKIN